MNIYQKFLNKNYNVKKVNDFRELIYNSEKKYSEVAAFKLKDKIITYRQFKTDYQYLSTWLLTLGYKNAKIALIGNNSYEWILTYLSVSTIGVVVPIDKELNAKDILDFVYAAECKAVIADSQILKKIVPLIKSGIRTYSTNNLGNELITPGKNEYMQGKNEIDSLSINVDEMKILLFTSGTTGKPKGVCLSQKNICSNIYSAAKMVKVDKTRHALSMLPLHHTYELTLGHLLLLSAGGCISYNDGLLNVAKNIDEYKPTVIITVPRLLETLLKIIDKNVRNGLPQRHLKNNNDSSFFELFCSLPIYMRIIIRVKTKKSLGGKLKLLIVGAAGIDPEIVKSFYKLGIKTYQGYGLTECSPLLAGNNDFYMNPYSTGLPVYGVELKIDNPNEEGIGEIIVRGDNVMLGYYNDIEETNKVIINGYFHTGDLGKIDDDGFLYITGRSKNVIVTKNGKNIYPEELETKLCEEKVISEALVIGVPNKKGDTSIKAKIVPDIKMIDEMQGKVTNKEEIKSIIQSVVDKINKIIPSYKRIEIIEIISDTLEKNTIQKIKRYGINMRTQ